MAFTFWCHLLDPSTFFIVDVDNKYIKILQEMAKVNFVSGRLSELYKDEFDEICENLSKYNLKTIFNSNYGLFIRMNYFSPKDSNFWNKLSPFKNWNDILTVIASSKRTASSLFFDDGNKLILRPWRFDYKHENEFRVFIYKKQIKAISQYYWHEDFKLVDKINVTKLVDKITEFFETIKDKYELNDFVMDVVVDNYVVELLEFNTLYISGPCCFSWKTEKHKLINDDNNIYFKMTTF